MIIINDFKQALTDLSCAEYALNDKGDRVEQKTAKAFKDRVVDALITDLTNRELVVNDEGDTVVIKTAVDNAGKPVIVMPNGLKIGFDFVIKKLNSEIIYPKG